MSEEPARPDPDALLRRVQQEQAREHRGKLRVFFGFAPGVGKTFRMLQVARELVSAQRIDVVVGIVETHRRYDTASLVLGLELLPRKSLEHRGQRIEEFDLDAALARRPKLVLVDELAHTNAPGSRHKKRWQDVEELLDAGIDVFTTLNVQHIESLNDVVTQITNIRVRETVPDSVLDRADSIELVDITPEELLERLREGKVYLGEQAQRAADNFFRRGNLLALRELALRRTAQRVDDDVLEYRAQHGVSAPWPSGERILVAVGPAPSSDRLIRAAARMAAGLRCPWVAAWVDTATMRSSEDRERLEAHLRLAESLGATIARLSGPAVADALLTYARASNVTRIIFGKPTHSWLRDRLKGSVLDAVVRGSGAIDVHIIRGDPSQSASVSAKSEARDSDRPSAQSYAVTVSIVAIALGVALVWHRVFSLPDAEMFFLLAVMVVAVRFGRAPSLLAAALGVGCYDFFFVPPYWTFSVSDRRYFLTFAMLFGVGFALSSLADRLRRQERDAIAREARTAALYALTRELSSVHDETAVCLAAVRHASALFEQGSAVVLLPDETRALRVVAATPEAPTLDAKDESVARWCFEHAAIAGLGTDTLPGSRVLCAPLRTSELTLGVIALAPSDPTPLRAEQRASLAALTAQIAATLDRVRLAELARAAALKAQTEEMRASLLSTVSHDLRTPLATITGAATTLRDEPSIPAKTQAELIGSICDEADRLGKLVTNLLDMTRLESGTVALKRDWVPLDEVVGSTLHRLRDAIGDRAVNLALGPETHWLFIDPVLFEQALLNLVENALKYAPDRSPIELRATSDEDSTTIEVVDHGPGIRAGDERRVFEKFYRANDGIAPGAGLGLAICRAIVLAHEGTIDARNGPDGGAIFRVRLPRVGEPPSLSLEPSP